VKDEKIAAIKPDSVYSARKGKQRTIYSSERGNQGIRQLRERFTNHADSMTPILSTRWIIKFQKYILETEEMNCFFFHVKKMKP
jgi:hypothetical protein